MIKVNLIDEAIEFAALKHNGQYRKGTDIPYISHPYGVGMILFKARCNEEQIIAGILHDTLEDTDTTPSEIEEKFGPNVLKFVRSCSEPNKGASWLERKQHTHEFLKKASLEIREVACADKLHNLRAIKRDLIKYGDVIWNKFNARYTDQKWYYEGIVEALGYRSGFKLLDELQIEVNSVFNEITDSKWYHLRQNKNFFDLAFESVYGLNQMSDEWIYKMKKIGGYEIIEKVHSLSYPIHTDFEDEFYDTEQYFRKRGVEFQSNSDGPIILIGFCAVLKKLLNLYPHEVYHHFNRNLKRGIL
jgi:hypothetical protein